MTLKLNKEVTREQLEELGFDFKRSYKGIIGFYDYNDFTLVRVNIVTNVTSIITGEIEIKIPTIIKTMIERGMC